MMEPAPSAAPSAAAEPTVNDAVTEEVAAEEVAAAEPAAADLAAAEPAAAGLAAAIAAPAAEKPSRRRPSRSSRRGRRFSDSVAANDVPVNKTTSKKPCGSCGGAAARAVDPVVRARLQRGGVSRSLGYIG